MDELIRKLEDAQVGSRELDIEIFLRINKVLKKEFDDYGGIGWFVEEEDEPGECSASNFICWERSAEYCVKIPLYTTSLDAARSITDCVLINLSDVAADGLALAQVGDPRKTPSESYLGMHANLVIALCLAQILASGT